MDPKKLAMIRAFTPPRLSDAERPRLSAFKVDPLIGKGEGRVIVLHGPPGVGKTYTAECMAETTSKRSESSNARRVLSINIFPRSTSTAFIKCRVG